MGKRSDFARIPKDLYRTWDKRAARPLLAFLRRGALYREPCAGAGDLIAQLAGHAVCVGASDIAPLAPGILEADMMSVVLGDAEAFITNPPWTRKLLHPLIVHLSDQGPTWLLFDAAWAFTKQAAPFMERCRKIVVVGRLRWIEGSAADAKDDCAWYEFGPPIPGSRPVFYGHGSGPQVAERARRVCYDCGQVIGQRGRWRLAERHGVVTTVHRRCDAPTSVDAPEAAPLLDFIAQCAKARPPESFAGSPRAYDPSVRREGQPKNAEA